MLSRLSIFPPYHFNSQPHKEADALFGIYTTSLHYFNSQPHKEADDYEQQSLDNPTAISTHSLTRRLTEDGEQTFNFKPFQLTASQGG